jgi:hypothetical protein
MKRSPSCPQLLNKFPAFYGAQSFATALTTAHHQTDHCFPHFHFPLLVSPFAYHFSIRAFFIQFAFFP